VLYKRVTDLKNDCILYFVTFSNKTDTGLLLRDISVSSEVLVALLNFILPLKTVKRLLFFPLI